MRYRNRSSNTPRTMVAKYAGVCRCCGAPIAAGEMVDYYPAMRAIGHIGALDGNSPRCTAELRKRNADPGFVDLDRMFEDQCNDICNR